MLTIALAYGVFGREILVRQMLLVLGEYLVIFD